MQSGKIEEMKNSVYENYTIEMLNEQLLKINVKLSKLADQSRTVDPNEYTECSFGEYSDYYNTKEMINDQITDCFAEYGYIRSLIAKKQLQ